METGGSVMVNQRPLPKKNNPTVLAFNDGSNRSSCLPRWSSQQILHNPGASVDAGFLGPRPPPPYISCPLPAKNPIYSSLPPPPLLPLPLSKSSSPPHPAVSAERMMAGAAAVRSAHKGRRKPRSPPAKRKGDAHPGSAWPRKEPVAASPSVNVPMSSGAAAASAAKDVPPEEEGFTGDVFSLSPPPSSLPMPKFLLLRPRATTKPWEVMRHLEVGVDAGASDGLRRLLLL